jgi:DNA-binding response OmpR family regulator
VYLTSTETDLLRALMASPGTVRTRGDLGRAVWGKKNIVSRAIDAHILRIRKKLGNDVIRAAYGAGYALAVPRGRSNKRVA